MEGKRVSCGDFGLGSRPNDRERFVLPSILMPAASPGVNDPTTEMRRMKL